ncbi:hypothetical protein QTP88_002368 [Uroleucon formosanum]
MEDKIKMLSSTSGATKKRKQKKIEESKAKLPKITSFLKGANKEIVEKIRPDISNNLRDNVTNVDDHSIESVNKNPSINNNEPIIFNINVNLINTENVNIVNEPESFEVDLPKPQTLILENTDIDSFQGNTLTDHLKTMIFSPSCRPTGPFPRDPLQNNRTFSKIYYQRQTKQGFVERAWLCYSLKMDAVYCEPRWLFSNISQDQWHNHSIRDWKHLSQKISQHENSKSHLTSCFVYDQWKQNRSLNTKIEEQYRYNVSFWDQVLERLFSITLALSKTSLAFRGHCESITDTYNGNFLTQVKLLAKYDDVLKHIMSMPKGSIKYLSPQIQNEIIHCLANELRRVLISKIKTAPFYSIIIDTTQDISKKDQLSEVYGYINIIKNEKSEPVSVEIEEVFLEFSEVCDHSAVGLSTKIKQLLHNNNMDLLQCRGQGYDGTGVMSGAYGGVQALIRQVQPNALYVHCASHNLNLAINDAAKCSIEVESFFTTLEDIYTFFGSSINRWDLLSKFTGESTITLKKLNPTRWAGRYMTLLAIKLRYIDIMKALNEMNLNTNKPDERNKAILYRWTPEDISSAITLRSISPKSYRYTIKKKIPLRWVSNISIEEGILTSVLFLMKAKAEFMSTSDKLTVISFNEIYVSSRICFEKKINGSNQYFMTDTKATKDLLYYIIENLYSIGFNVLSMVSDMGSSNVGLWKSLDVSTEKTSFEHPKTRNNVYVFEDPPHLLKLARNHLLDNMKDKLLDENDCFTAKILSSFNDYSIHANNEANIEGNVITVPESDFQLLKQFEIDTENVKNQYSMILKKGVLNTLLVMLKIDIQINIPIYHK